MQPNLQTFQMAIDRVLLSPPSPSHDELSNYLITRLLVILERLDEDLLGAKDALDRQRVYSVTGAHLCRTKPHQSRPGVAVSKRRPRNPRPIEPLVLVIQEVLTDEEGNRIYKDLSEIPCYFDGRSPAIATHLATNHVPG